MKKVMKDTARTSSRVHADKTFSSQVISSVLASTSSVAEDQMQFEFLVIAARESARPQGRQTKDSH